MLTNIIYSFISFCFRWLVDINPASSIWTKWSDKLSHRVPSDTLNIMRMSIQNLMDTTWRKKKTWINITKTSNKYVNKLLLLTFVYIPYYARIVNWSCKKKLTINWPPQVQDILSMKPRRSYQLTVDNSKINLI